MDLKKFYYLYMKARDEEKEAILKEANLTEEEYGAFEYELKDELKLIKAERTAIPDIGADFVRLSRYMYESVPDQQKDIFRPEAVKALPGEIIPLPAIHIITKPDMTLWQAIDQRRSLRKYAETGISQEELSFLLWATQWVRDFRSNEKMEVAFRNVPSAGARHPFETYLLINNVEGIKPGLYYYHPIKHGLVCYKEGAEVAQDVLVGTFEQEMTVKSAVTFIWVAIPYRASWRYGQRAYRYLYIDAGHVGQNLHLAAEAIGCGAVMIGAFYDEGMDALLGLDSKDAFVIYMAALGKKLID